MRPAAALALALLALAGGLRAGLVNPVLSGPGNIADGAAFTVTLNVQNNNGVGSIYQVQPFIGASNGGVSISQMNGPYPASQTVTAGSNITFTWYVTASGCGTATFTASASGIDSSATPVASGTSNAYTATLYCTPTPTPTQTPVLSPTPTPWVVYKDLPREGSATILGNLFRPLAGTPLQLKALLPEASTLRVDLYDRLGRLVRHFEVGGAAGENNVAFDGRGDDGVMLATGIYAAHFRARGLDQVVKFAVLK